jgi:KEOPS complex subunit Pcc1
VQETVFSADYPDAARARVVERAVRREVGEIAGDRSRAAVERDGATLTVTVDADDLVGLRAALNTWSGLVGVAEATAAAAADRRPED